MVFNPNDPGNSPLADSVSANGVTTAPGAGVTLASIAAGSLPAGLYEVTVCATLGTTGSLTADGNNMALLNGAATVGTIPVSNPGTNVMTVRRVTMNGANALAVKAIGAATAGAVYTVSMYATRIG